MTKFYLTIFVLAAAIAPLPFAKATDYCSTSVCNPGVKHIACGHDGKLSSNCPDDAEIVKIDASLQTILVNAHNAKRNSIAGGSAAHLKPACRMATMQWDPELASVAEYNVKQCVMAHEQCRNTDTFRYSGQNLAWMGYFGAPNSPALLQQAVDMWYSEVEDTTIDHINAYPSNYKGPAIGHFTVMVADRNIRVGCAAATYSVAGASYKAYLVACNYATTNMINFPIYATCSAAGTNCSSGKNPSYPNLCATSEAYDVNKWF